MGRNWGLRDKVSRMQMVTHHTWICFPYSLLHIICFKTVTQQKATLSLLLTNMCLLSTNASSLSIIYFSLKPQSVIKIPHEVIKKDPKSIKNTLADFRNHSYLPENIKKSCHPHIGTNIPFVWTTKNHKLDKPMRLLVAKYTAPIINVIRTLTHLLKPYFMNHPYIIKKSYKVK